MSKQITDEHRAEYQRLRNEADLLIRAINKIYEDTGRPYRARISNYFLVPDFADEPLPADELDQSRRAGGESEEGEA